MFGAKCAFLLAAVAAQEAPQLQKQLATEQQSLQQADQAASFWQSQTQTQTAELHDALSHEKATALGSVSLTACLRTRDVVQMEMARLQAMQDDLSQKARNEKVLATNVTETMHTGLSECEARLKTTLANDTAAIHKLQSLQAKVLKEHDDSKGSLEAAQEEQRKLNIQVAEQQKEFEKQLADVKADQSRKVANFKKQHAKIMEAHDLLKKAHEALQNQHDAMQKEQDKQKAQWSQQSSQQDSLQEKLQQCKSSLKNSTESQAKIRDGEKSVHLAAHSAGAEQSNQKWNEILQNMTAENDKMKDQLEALAESAEEQERKAKSVDKDIPELEMKLRQCRASREKTELQTQKALEHCPKKEAFLQMQMMDWP